MAELTESQKREIVEGLATFQSPTSIIHHFRSAHDLNLTHKQIGRYDPTRPYFDAGERWRPIFEARRRAFLESIADVPVAHKAYRLTILQEGVEAARAAGNWVLVMQLLRQAAREVGGALTNERIASAADRSSAARDMNPEERKAALAGIIERAVDQMRGRDVQSRAA